MARSGPTLDAMLADPLIQTLMRADRVETVALKQMLTGVAARRRERALDVSGARVSFCGQTRLTALGRLRSAAETCRAGVSC